MSMHEFDITRNGTLYTLRVAKCEIDFDNFNMLVAYDVQTINWSGEIQWMPLQVLRPGASSVFEPDAIIAACNAVGAQQVNNAAGLKTYLNTLAEKLAELAWAD